MRCEDDDYVDFTNFTRKCKKCPQYCLEETIDGFTTTNVTQIVNGTNQSVPITVPIQTKVSYCDTAFGCMRCKPGFYVTPNGECSSCSPHCALCDQTLGCLHCLGDTHMINGRCEFNGASSVLILLIVLILAFAI